jgi:hypothetical protein
MTLKGLILPGHVPVNKFALTFPGMPPLVITKLGGLEEELEVVEQPDRTVHSNGQTKATEMTFELPMHHVIEQAAMESWYEASKDPVLPGYKKDGTLVHLSVSAVGLPVVFSVEGCFPKARKTPEMDMSNESDAAVVEWTVSVDNVSPI